MPTPAVIADLVQRFEQQGDAYKSGHYNEAQLRKEFVDPMFKALGWDMDNISGYAEAYKDVIHEDAIKIGGATKAPDYCFRIGGTRKFFLEAKKPSVDIKTEAHPAYQLRRYAWSAKLPLSILTDFEEFAVYDCRVEPKLEDKASVARVLYLDFHEYASRWDDIAKIFARDAILKGSFDKFAESTKAKRGTAEVDDAFLDEIERWRADLARNLALRNPELSQRDLNFSVQRTIDRIVFLRICEDRRIEVYGRLQALLNGEHAYRRLYQFFREADDRYNSGLFYFQKERDRVEPPDDLTPELEIDDGILKKIIRRLYYPDSPYEFSVLPADILGQVYEQFLGKVIRLTEGHQAKIEDKPEVKKAGGVYYTPTYVVDYIVKNTVGRLLENKTPKQAAKLRILDPACGSGSFLISAYQYLLDWHRDWYVDHDPKRWATGRNPALYRGTAGEWKLTTGERKRILLQNIFGVDIDAQAVEVTKLSLLLKVLEGESEQTLATQLRFYHERALPDLGRNIKCGNSLIGPDFYDQQQMDFFDEEERYRINVFDWDVEFREIMKGGGFDAVIGNPPYNALLSETEVAWLRAKYEGICGGGRADTAANFFERAVQLKAKHIGFLLPYRLVSRRRNHGPFQVWLVDNVPLVSVLYMGPIKDIKANDEFMIVLARSGSVSGNRVAIGLDVTPGQLETDSFAIHTVRQSTWGAPDYDLNIRASLFCQPLLRRMKTCTMCLGDIAESRDGIVPHIREKLISTRRLDSRYKPFIGLAGLYRLQRYSLQYQLRYLCYSMDEARKWIRDKTELRKVQLRDESIFLQPRKILTAQDSPTIKGTIDEKRLYHSNSMHSTYLKPDTTGYELEYLLGLLNSKALNYYHSSLVTKGTDLHPQVLVTNLPKLRIPMIDFSKKTDKDRHDRMVSLVRRMLALHKQLAAAKTGHAHTNLQRQIDATDAQIDKLAYELYGLTKDEKKIVENAEP